MGLEISYSNGFVLDKNLEVKLNQAFEVISGEEDLSQYSINIRIVNDKEMIDLNRKFRKKDSSTNVLSFTYSNDNILQGDLAICSPLVKQEANAQNKSEKDHWIHLFVHGLLHLQGWDHQNDQDEKAMQQQEDEILEKISQFDNINDI